MEALRVGFSRLRRLQNAREAFERPDALDELPAREGIERSQHSRELKLLEITLPKWPD